jgi:hypothetical protein
VQSVPLCFELDESKFKLSLQTAVSKNVSTEAEGRGEDPAEREDSSTCCSELQSVGIGDRAVVSCSYGL